MARRFKNEPKKVLNTHARNYTKIVVLPTIGSLYFRTLRNLID